MICRLASPLAIEREIDEVIAKLYGMIPKLEATLSHFETVKILASADDLSARLTVLQVDLERFNRESAREEDDAWDFVQSEWQNGSR